MYTLKVRGCKDTPISGKLSVRDLARWAENLTDAGHNHITVCRAKDGKTLLHWGVREDRFQSVV